jgi:hypothetical protein
VHWKAVADGRKKRNLSSVHGEQLIRGKSSLGPYDINIFKLDPSQSPD